MDPRDPRHIVRTGYDLVSHAYRADDFVYEGTGYERHLDWVLPELSETSRVLDLGCGNGLPVARVLSDRCQVIGVDISPVQIERACRLVPGGDFTCIDITEYRAASASFDGVVAFYSIIHVPLAEHRALIERVCSWLRPGGFFLAAVGFDRWTGIERDWKGVEGATMYWSHADRETYLRWFEAAGLTVEREGFIPEDDGGHTILLGRKVS